MDKHPEIIVSNDWTKNWQASIAVKITAITLWPTIFVVFIAAFFLLNDLDEQVRQEQYNTSIKVAYHASNLWPATVSLTFPQKLERLRNDYRELDLPGFELTNQGQHFRIGNLEIQPSYYDLQLHTQTDNDPAITIRTFFPEPHAAAELIRNKIIAITLSSLVLFGIFLSLATRIILDKPLQGLVHATKMITEGHH